MTAAWPDSLQARLAREAKLHARKAAEQARMIGAPHEPCGRCGTRADVGCRHQPPSGPPPLALQDSPDEPVDRRRSAHAPRWNE